MQMGNGSRASPARLKFKARPPAVAAQTNLSSYRGCGQGGRAELVWDLVSGSVTATKGFENPLRNHVLQTCKEFRDGRRALRAIATLADVPRGAATHLCRRKPGACARGGDDPPQRGGSAMGDRGRSEAGGQTSTRSSAMRSRSTRMETTWSAKDH